MTVLSDEQIRDFVLGVSQHIESTPCTHEEVDSDDCCLRCGQKRKEETK